MHIFICYGHDHTILARRLCVDLESEGHTVWMDERKDGNGIGFARKWEDSIEGGIQSADWIVALMSPHSMRRPDGVCLDEVSFARFLNKDIAPVMVQLVQPPLCIARLNWIDFQGWLDQETGGIRDTLYTTRYRNILRTLKGEFKGEVEGGQTDLMRILDPLDNEHAIASHVKEFVGREWLFETYECWRDDSAGARVFFLTGLSGTGKSAFSALLCHRDPAVMAAHFGRINDLERGNPLRAIRSLAHQLGTQLPAYQEQLKETVRRSLNLETLDIRTLFDRLLTAPLARIPTPDHRVVLVLDALDQTRTPNGDMPLAEALADGLERLPAWVRMVVTSRPDPDILALLSRYQPLAFEANSSAQNQDIQRFLTVALNDRVEAGRLQNVILQLLPKCDGNFLYAVEMVRDIQEGRQDPERPEGFPKGLVGIHAQHFHIHFPDIEAYKRRHRPFFELIAVSREPLPENTAARILHWDDYERDDVILPLRSLFPVRDGLVTAYNASLVDWMTESTQSGPYRVSRKAANDRFAKGLLDWYDQAGPWALDAYALKHTIQHLELAGRTEPADRIRQDPLFLAARLQHCGPAGVGVDAFSDGALIEGTQCFLATAKKRTAAVLPGLMGLAKDLASQPIALKLLDLLIKANIQAHAQGAGANSPIPPSKWGGLPGGADFWDFWGFGLDLYCLARDIAKGLGRIEEATEYARLATAIAADHYGCASYYFEEAHEVWNELRRGQP